MVLDPSKCLIMTLGVQDQNFDLHYEDVLVRNSGVEKINGITVYNQPNLKSLIINIPKLESPLQKFKLYIPT